MFFPVTDANGFIVDDHDYGGTIAVSAASYTQGYYVEEEIVNEYGEPVYDEPNAHRSLSVPRFVM